MKNLLVILMFGIGPITLHAASLTYELFGTDFAESRSNGTGDKSTVQYPSNYVCDSGMIEVPFDSSIKANGIKQFKVEAYMYSTESGKTLWKQSKIGPIYNLSDSEVTASAIEKYNALSDELYNKCMENRRELLKQLNIGQ